MPSKLRKTIELKQLESIQGGMSQFYTPQSSHETMLVQIPPHSIDDLFVHHFQTDQSYSTNPGLFRRRRNGPG